MNDQKYKVQIGEIIKEYEVGTSYQKIAADFQQSYPDDILLVFANDRLQELRKTLQQDIVIRFVTAGDLIGHQTYKRSMCFLMVKAIYDVAQHQAIQKVRVHFSVDRGYYTTIEGDIKLTQDFLDRVKVRMQEMVERDIPLNKRSLHTDDAIALFKKYGMYDKEKLFRYRRVSRVNIYSINEFEDYYYGYMVPSTSYLKYFELYLYDEGLVLQMPARKESKVVRPLQPQNKLFQVMKESTKWGDLQGIETVGALNDQVTHGDAREVILVQEAMQEKRIAEIAEEIVQKGDIKLILIAGPSSSGKTTFSHRLSIQLRASGLVPHPIGVDNYFVDRKLAPRDENGELDLESILAVDVDYFNADMKALLEGKEIKVPRFDFIQGKRNYTGETKKLGEHDILVIEGIHCLNPQLTEKLPDRNKFKIYISALTQLNIDEHNRIPSTDGRLIRRIVRDARTRGTKAKETIAMWSSVRRGEEANIFPYQEEADVMFNSALVYELAVLKQYIEPLLFGIEKDCQEYIEAKRLLKFLDYFVGLNSDYIPMNSLVREFIGGGCYHV